MSHSVCNPGFDVSRARLMAGLSGPLLLGLGSGISVSAGFGAFGFSVLLDGIHASTELPMWVSQIVITFLFYVGAGLWAGIPLGAGTIPSVLLIGPAISFGATVTPENLTLIGNIFGFLAGLFLFALGISLAAAAALGPDGITALSLAAEKQTRLSVPQSNFLLNLTAILIGTALGGKFGLATIFGLLAVPVLIKHMLPALRQQLSHGIDSEKPARVIGSRQALSQDKAHRIAPSRPH